MSGQLESPTFAPAVISIELIQSALDSDALAHMYTTNNLGEWDVPSGLVGCGVHKEIYYVPFHIRDQLALRNGVSGGMLALAVAGLASLCQFLFGTRDGSASREVAVVAVYRPTRPSCAA